MYYISYIYEQSWGHGDAVMLVGPQGVNTPATVRQASEAVERWLATIDRIGIAEARAQHVGPLRGTSLYWYGRPAPNDAQ